MIGIVSKYFFFSSFLLFACFLRLFFLSRSNKNEHTKWLETVESPNWLKEYNELTALTFPFECSSYDRSVVGQKWVTIHVHVQCSVQYKILPSIIGKSQRKFVFFYVLGASAWTQLICINEFILSLPLTTKQSLASGDGAIIRNSHAKMYGKWTSKISSKTKRRANGKESKKMTSGKEKYSENEFEMDISLNGDNLIYSISLKWTPMKSI